MAVRLRSENGTADTYHTYYTIYGGNDNIDRYRTKCGLEWTSKPKLEEECSHFDCAIGAAEENMTRNKSMGLIIYAAAAFWVIIFLWYARELISIVNPLSLIFGIIGTTYIIKWRKFREDYTDLCEFRDYETLKGATATII